MNIIKLSTLLFMLMIVCNACNSNTDNTQEEANKAKSEEQLKMHRDSMRKTFQVSSKSEAAAYIMEGAPLPKVNEQAVKQLRNKFTISKDNWGTSLFTPKTAPKYVDRSTLYCYFAKDSLWVNNFSIVIQHYGKTLLNIKQFVFDIDGKQYILNRTSFNNESSGVGMHAEWADEAVDYSNKEIITALSTAKSAKMRFVGEQQSEEKVITQQELKSISDAVALYGAMGGEL